MGKYNDLVVQYSEKRDRRTNKPQVAELQLPLV